MASSHSEHARRVIRPGLELPSRTATPYRQASCSSDLAPPQGGSRAGEGPPPAGWRARPWCMTTRSKVELFEQIRKAHDRQQLSVRGLARTFNVHPVDGPPSARVGGPAATEGGTSSLAGAGALEVLSHWGLFGWASPPSRSPPAPCCWQAWPRALARCWPSARRCSCSSSISPTTAGCPSSPSAWCPWSCSPSFRPAAGGAWTAASPVGAGRSDQVGAVIAPDPGP